MGERLCFLVFSHLSVSRPGLKISVWLHWISGLDLFEYWRISSISETLKLRSWELKTAVGVWYRFHTSCIGHCIGCKAMIGWTEGLDANLHVVCVWLVKSGDEKWWLKKWGNEQCSGNQVVLRHGGRKTWGDKDFFSFLLLGQERVFFFCPFHFLHMWTWKELKWFYEGGTVMGLGGSDEARRH